MAEAARLAQAGQIEKAIRLVRELHPDMAPDVAQDVVDALAGRAGTRLDTRRGR
jgi:hypothetical protein